MSQELEQQQKTKVTKQIKEKKKKKKKEVEDDPDKHQLFSARAAFFPPQLNSRDTYRREKESGRIVLGALEVVEPLHYCSWELFLLLFFVKGASSPYTSEIEGKKLFSLPRTFLDPPAGFLGSWRTRSSSRSCRS